MLFVIRKVGQRKIFFSQRKIWLYFQGKCFPFISDEKYFLKVMKNLEILYYLLIISNLILKFLIDIYFVWIFFLISSLKFWFNLTLKFDFYINFGFYFYDCYLLFSYYFFNWNFLPIKFDPHSFNYYLFYLK